MSEAQPMGTERRVINYYIMTGSRRLTPRQRRRVQHKKNADMRRVGMIDAKS